MARIKKFLKGEAITSLAQLEAEIFDKKTYVFFYGRHMHYGWVQSMQISFLRAMVRKGVFFFAETNPAWIENEARIARDLADNDQFRCSCCGHVSDIENSVETPLGLCCDACSPASLKAA